MAERVSVPKVYLAIHAVMTALAKIGIAKDRQNEQQQYRFRGIDQVYEALSPLLVEHGLLILPEQTERLQTERTTRQGGTIISVVLTTKYRFVSVEDGSEVAVTMYGEGMDTGDKATGKAASAAYKYAAFQTFCIPIEGGMDDADYQTHELAGPPPPPGYDVWRASLIAASGEGLKALNKVWRASSAAMREYIDEHEGRLRDKLRDDAEAASHPTPERPAPDHTLPV